jgi:hypothetical protein
MKTIMLNRTKGFMNSLDFAKGDQPRDSMWLKKQKQKI